MFQRVVVGVDGSDGGRDAVELARQLLSPTGRVILANVYSDAGTAGLGGRLVSRPSETVRTRCWIDADKTACPRRRPSPALTARPAAACIRSLRASTPICWPSVRRIAAWSVAS